MRSSILTVVLVAGLWAPAVARGVVLEEAPSSTVACGDDLRFGVWYRSWDGGPRTVTMTVKSVNGHTLARRTVQAPTYWKHYYYTPRCGHHYLMSYAYPSGIVSRYRVWVQQA
jgi:hypothetical protein